MTNVDSVGVITARSGIDVTGNITVTGTVDGRDVAADGTKLDGIESGATADQTASEILTAIKTVDGSGSGLDADLLDGQQGSYYQPASTALTTSTTFGGDVSGTYNAIVVTNDSHTHDTRYYTETESDARFLGISAKAADSNLLDGIDSASFLRSDANDTATGQITLSGGVSSNGKDYYSDNGAFIANDADGAFATRTGNNIDHIWHNDSSNTWHFCSDTTYKNGGNSTVYAGAFSAGGSTVWHAGNDGSGSGLDADTLDGVNSGSFLRSDANDSATGLYSFAAGAYSNNVTYGGRGITAQIDINSTSMRGGVLVRNANDFRSEVDSASFMHYDAYNTSATSYAFRAAKGTTLADTFWVKGDGTGYFADDVGIGINNPGAKLDVFGTARIGGTNSSGRRADFDTDGRLTLAYGDNSNTSNLILANLATGATTNHGSNIAWDFGTNTSGSPITAARIDVVKEQQWTSTASTQDAKFAIVLAENGVLGDKLSISSNGNVTLTGDLDLDDNKKILLGTGNDCEIYHNGTHNIFESTNGNISIQVPAGSEIQLAQGGGSFEQGVKFIAGGAVQLFNNNSLKLATTSTGVNVTGDLILSGELNLMGSSDSNKFLDVRVGTNTFHIRKTTGGDAGHEVMATFTGDAGVGLYYNAVKKFETTSTGVTVTGLLSATTKSFVIDHPTKEGMKLRHGSLEGPENGVYIRGRLKDNNTIELPDYWTGLVDEETITVNLTPIGRKSPLHSIVDIVDNTVVVESANDIVDCFYTVFGERKDVERFEVEF